MKYRANEIFQSIEEEMKSKLLENIEKIQDNLQPKEEEIKNSLFSKIDNLLNNYMKEESTVYILISPLKSSILTKSYEVSLMLSNEEIYLDDNPIYEYFSISDIFEYIEEDIKYFEKLIHNNFKNVTKFEMKGFRLKYEELYMELYIFLIAYFIQKLKLEKLNNTKYSKVVFLYGKFMENTGVIGEIEKEIGDVV